MLAIMAVLHGVASQPRQSQGCCSHCCGLWVHGSAAGSYHCQVAHTSCAPHLQLIGVRMLRIGIDVGGTNTDAVVMDGTQVVDWVKMNNSADITSGIAAALQELLAKAHLQTGQIGAVMIGTTQFTNAVVQRRDLTRVAAIRLALPATQSLPPMIDWPEDLREAVGNT